MWDVVKKALNSNLGKPLNTLITEVTEEIKTKIGNAGDTGGAVGAGSVLGKLNKVITDTQTNNTANSAGTLSQKLQWLINTWNGTKAGYIDASVNSRQSEANAASRYNALSARLDSVKPSSTGVGVTVFSGSSRVQMSTTTLATLAKFVAPVTGYYQVNLTSGSNYAFRALKTSPYANGMYVSEQWIAPDVGEVYRTNSVGAQFNVPTEGFGNTNSLGAMKFLQAMGKGASTNGGVTTTGMFCVAGEPVCIVGVGLESGSYAYCSAVTVTCQKA